jgi:DNA polymerase III epsilon subunit-like protein
LLHESETFISVDVEAAGPIPGEYSLLSIGACVVGDTAKNFYVELKPITFNFVLEAMTVAGFDLHELERSGLDPREALLQFETWLRSVTPIDQTPIFVGYPLAFDWMFVAYYFQRFVGHNPFGYQGLDIKSYNMGLTGSRWDRSGTDQTGQPYVIDLTHNAREDAIAQAKVFERLLKR